MDGNIITEFVTLCPKVYAINYEEYDFKNSNHKIKTSKRAKGTKKCVIKKDLHFDDYMLPLFGEKTIMRDQIRFKSDCHNIYTVKVNKVALRNRDNKRLQDYKVTTYPVGTNPYIVCKSEMKIKLKLNNQAIPLYYFGDKTVNTDNIDNNPVNIDNIDNNPVNKDIQEVNINNIDNSPVNTDNQEVNIDNIGNNPVNTDNQEVNIDNTSNTDNTIAIQKNSVLQAKDMEMILKKFICEQFMSQKFNSRRLDKHTVKLVSYDEMIKSKIQVYNAEILVCFEKHKKSINRCVKININRRRVILELYLTEYKKKRKKKSYITLYDNKISAYTTTIFVKNKDFTKYVNEEMEYTGIRVIIENEIIYCLEKIYKID